MRRGDSRIRDPACAAHAALAPRVLHVDLEAPPRQRQQAPPLDELSPALGVAKAHDCIAELCVAQSVIVAVAVGGHDRCAVGQAGEHAEEGLEHPRVGGTQTSAVLAPSLCNVMLC